MPARNALNVDALDEFLANLGDLAAHDAVRDWLKGTARRHILREHERVYEVVREKATGLIVLAERNAPDWHEPRPLDGPVPDWCAAALDRGDRVVFLRLDGPLAKTVRRTIEHLDGLLDRPRPRNIKRIGYRQAVGDARKARRERPITRRPRQEPGAIPVFRHGRSVSVVQLTMPENLVREGTAMNHCVADYADALRLEECEIYSVRDRTGASHATIEVDPDGRVIQVKGQGNGPVAAEFRPAIRAFIARRGYEMLYDFWNISDIADWVLTSGLRLEETLSSHEGQMLLRANRFAGGARQPDLELAALAQLICTTAYDMSPRALAAIFRALSPGTGAPVHLRVRGGHWVYDTYVSEVQVDVPLLLLNLIRFGIFTGTPVEAEGLRVLRAVENILPTLVFRELDRIYLLGRTRVEPVNWIYFDWASTADVLLDCPYDIRRQRANRHRAFLERLNRAKRRVASRASPASDTHTALRRLVTGAAGIYAI
ncbi:MAG: PcfJ domain-containing protein [Alphaproteobacteria bacterium]|nr:PcfJ domain-containing protein [Alphaproteobacteria bacterium]